MNEITVCFCSFFEKRNLIFLLWVLVFLCFVYCIWLSWYLSYCIWGYFCCILFLRLKVCLQKWNKKSPNHKRKHDKLILIPFSSENDHNSLPWVKSLKKKINMFILYHSCTCKVLTYTNIVSNLLKKHAKRTATFLKTWKEKICLTQNIRILQKEPYKQRQLHTRCINIFATNDQHGQPSYVKK